MNEWEDRIRRRADMARIQSLPIAQRRAAEQELARRYDHDLLKDLKKRADAHRTRPHPQEEIPF